MSDEIKELLKERYLVIADYPTSKMYFHVGAILTWNDKYYECNSNIRMAKETVEGFPHLFRKLEWWEIRSRKEMPKYLKTVKSGKLGRVSKWKYEVGKPAYAIVGQFAWAVEIVIPITEAEYNT